MGIRSRVAVMAAAVLIAAGPAFAAGGCGEGDKQAETVTRNETKTVTKKDKKSKKTGTSPKTAPATPPAAPATPAAPAAPAAPAPGPGAGSSNAAADQASMVELIRSDPYYGGGDTYEVLAYDQASGTGTVLISTDYGNYMAFTEVYMAKDQYGWYAYDDYSYTIP